MDYILEHTDVPKTVHRPYLRPRKYPFHAMQPGMRFFVPDAKPGTLMSLASATGKRLGWKFVTRKLHMRLVGGKWEQCSADDKGAKLGVAVYRVA